MYIQHRSRDFHFRFLNVPLHIPMNEPLRGLVVYLDQLMEQFCIYYPQKRKQFCSSCCNLLCFLKPRIYCSTYMFLGDFFVLIIMSNRLYMRGFISYTALAKFYVLLDKLFKFSSFFSPVDTCFLIRSE